MSSTRIFTALALSIGVVGLLFLDRSIGSPAGSFVLVDALAILALAELLALFRAAGDPVWMRSGLVGGILLIGLHAVSWLFFPETSATAIGWILGGAALVTVGLVAMGPPGAGRTALGTLVLVGSMLFLLELRLISWPAHPVWGLGAVAVLIAVVKGGDSAAYFVGRTIGKRPMAPRISPKKTWEGAVAGFVVGTALAPALGLGLGLTPGLGWGAVLVLGAVTNVAGQVGDLVESHQKRRAGMKDSGRYLGELGGALDVLDAILLAAPVAYVTIHLLAPWGAERDNGSQFSQSRARSSAKDRRLLVCPRSRYTDAGDRAFRRVIAVEIKAEARRRRQVASSSTDNAELGGERRRNRGSL